jgi:DNA invertase Pin-like site-specific DNA recombinase
MDTFEKLFVRKIRVTVDKKHNGRLVGYARVSTVEQNLTMQTDALRKVGVPEERLHVEKISARATKRPAFEWALRTLRPGDTFIVWSIDRLGRDMREIHKSLDIIDASGAKLKSLTQPPVGEDSDTGRMMTNMFALLAENEWDRGRSRTRAGVEAARRRGVRFGQPPKLTPKQQAQCRKWKRQLKLSVRELVEKAKVEFKIKKLSHGAMQNYINPKPPKQRPTS